MKQIRYSIAAIALFLTTQSMAQKPVKIELAKLAETVTIPPSTIAEAYTKCKKENGVDGLKFFGEVYDRLDRVTKDIYTSTSQQNGVIENDKKAGEKAIADGFGDMSIADQAKYMKRIQHYKMQPVLTLRCWSLQQRWKIRLLRKSLTP